MHSLLLQNGEACLHAAAISGNPGLVSLLLEAGADPQLKNAGGHSALDLLIMFINYGNVSLTPNLLKVLNLLPQTQYDNHPVLPHHHGALTQEGLHKLRKLARIYCPINFNRACNVVRDFFATKIEDLNTR